VSVVIPVLNEARHLRAAIDAVLAQDYLGALDICLALGPSTDGTEVVADSIVQAHPNISVIPNPSGRTPTGLNAAIRATQGQVVVRVDGHSILPRGYVSRAVETLRRTGAANVGGVQRAVGNSPFEQAVALAMSSPFGMGGAKFHIGGSEGPVDTVYLGVFDRSSIEEVGLFDESLTRNQDYELNVRLRKAGKIVWFDPELAVDYTPRSSFGSLARQFYEYGAWKRHVLRMHPSSIRPRQAVPPIALIAIVGATVLGLFNKWLLGIPSAYLLAVLLASILAGQSKTSRVLLLCRIFPTIHMAWATGFLLGTQLFTTNSRDQR